MTSERVAHAQLAGGWIRYLAWLNDQEAIAVAQKGVIYRIDLKLRQVSLIELQLIGNIWSADLDVSRQKLCFGSDRGEVGVVHLAPGTWHTVSLRDRLISAVCWTKANGIVAGAASGEGFDLAYDSNGTWQVSVIQELANRDEITSLTSLNNQTLVVGYFSGTIAVIDEQRDFKIIGQHEDQSSL